MDVQPSIERLRGALSEVIGRSQMPLSQLSKGLGHHRNYLGKVLNGHLRVRVRELFELLTLLKVPPADFFDIYYPLGGLAHVRLRARYRDGELPIWGSDLRWFGELDAWRRSLSPPSPEELEERAARLLRQYVRVSPTTQRAISRELGLSPDALGLALRGNTRLDFRHVFGVLQAIGMEPERYFAELVGPEDRNLVDTLRWNQLLDEIERHLRPVIAAVEEAAASEKSDD